MTRENMLARLDKGEDPLELSIEKWKDIEEGKGEDRASGNCALCAVYSDNGNCTNCPVMKHTQRSQCYGTPYWVWSYDKGKAMRLFLEGLRK